MRLRDIFRKRRNGKSSSVVSQLPDDIVYELFEAAALVYPPRSLAKMPASVRRERAPEHTSLGWIILTHVCRRWRSIGLSATLAPLWARVVCFSKKYSVIDQLSLRAQGWPVTIDLTRYNGEPSDEALSSGSQLLKEWTCHNIGRVGVLIAPPMTLLDRLKSEPLVLPNLREVHLVGAELPRDFNPRWELSGLRSAWLYEKLLPHSLVVTLRELHLRLRTGLIPLVLLHDFLRACPYLEILDMDVTGDWPHEDSSDGPRPASVHRVERAAQKEAVVFEHLRQAKLAVDSSQMVLDLWLPIHSPPELSFQLAFSSHHFHKPLPRARDFLEACKREMDLASYDSLKFSNLGTRLRLSSTSTNASCELSWFVDDATRDTILSLLSSYMPTALPHITTLTLEWVSPARVHIDRGAPGALGRALTGVKRLNLRDLHFWSAALYVRALRPDAEFSPALPTLQTVCMTDIQVAAVRDRSELPQTRQWWDMIVSALAARREAGSSPLERLILDGKWLVEGKDVWSEIEDREGKEECKARGLVREVVDNRVWVMM
ncbi:hypothetical protein PENSPDRAFT_189568 [Peniophora sp. CONT]|nr:hypothetical protein PENSPDRAFT_189568 [Peniophora sp. CONT]